MERQWSGEGCRGRGRPSAEACVRCGKNQAKTSSRAELTLYVRRWSKLTCDKNCVRAAGSRPQGQAPLRMAGMCGVRCARPTAHDAIEVHDKIV